MSDTTTSALPLDTRGRVASAFLAIMLVGALLSLWADVQQVDLIGRVLDGGRTTLTEINDSDDRVAWTAAVYTIGYIPAAIAFLFWYSRAYRNVIAFGFPNRWSPRWAVAYWIIPILSLFRPKQVMNDIWRGSGPAGETDLRSRPVSPLLHWWWAAWLLTTWVSQVAFRASFEDGDFVSDPEDLRSQSIAYAISDVVDVVAGILAILVIRAVTARVEARRLAQSPGFAPPVAGLPTG
jgi:Domain of unknown function (DUF4328)